MANLAAFAYLVAGVLFILALRGLSHPTTSRKGNHYGMTGMAIAVLTRWQSAPISTPAPPGQPGSLAFWR